jgi:hypothetical protein
MLLKSQPLIDQADPARRRRVVMVSGSRVVLDLGCLTPWIALLSYDVHGAVSMLTKTIIPATNHCIKHRCGGNGQRVNLRGCYLIVVKSSALGRRGGGWVAIEFTLDPQHPAH